jgi:hypothetical protein
MGGRKLVMPDFRSEQLVRFSLREMLLSTTLLATGIVTVCLTIEPRPYLSTWSHIACWLSGGALIGASLFVPFKRPYIGAALGVLVQLGLLLGFLALVYAYGFKD